MIIMVDFRSGSGENSTQDDPADVLRILLRIGQGQGRAPRTAEENDPFKLQMLPQFFDIFPILRCVFPNLGIGLASVPPALVRQDYVELLGLK